MRTKFSDSIRLISPIRKIRLIAALSILFTVSTYSQINFKVSGSAVIPAGEFTKQVEAGYGFSVTGIYQLPVENFYVTLTGGYYFLGFNEKLKQYKMDYSTIPLTAGLKAEFPIYDLIPYVEIGAGIYFSKYQVEVIDIFTGPFTVLTDERTAGFLLSGGLRFMVTPGLDLDFSINYNKLQSKYPGRAFFNINTGFSVRF